MDTYAAEAITLEWIKPVDIGCSPITSYSIEFYDSVNSVWIEKGTANAEDLKGTATDLPAGELVKLRVIALNAISPNKGIPSEFIELTTSALPGTSTTIQVD